MMIWGIVPILKNAISPETMSKFEQGEGIILGETLARNYGIRTGDQVDIMVPVSDDFLGLGQNVITLYGDWYF